jgi:23S rRNA (uracil1939-C5)-methyltransferase
VELDAVRMHARFARAHVRRVVEPGPGRIAPRCRHYLADECGGCQLQHLDYPNQLAFKRDVVADALTRIGKLDVTVPGVMAAPDPWGYRSRITLAVAPGRRHAGLHPLEQASRVFPLERCEIAEPALMELWSALRTGLHLLPPDTEQLVLRIDREGGLHAVVKSAGEQAWSGGKRLAEATGTRGVAVTVWWHPEGGAPRVVAGDQEAFPATVFEQVHPALGDRIRLDALALLGACAKMHVWDLYAGVGETTERLSRLGASVESVELDRRAVDAAERRWRESLHGREESQRPEPAGVIRHAGRVEELVGRLGDPDAVIANPPRGGLDQAVTDELLKRRPARIVYVSCDPATLARDLGRLCGSAPRRDSSPMEPTPYRVTAVQSYDLFPQTAHVETVVLLEG